MNEVEVRFLPQNKAVQAAKGSNILDLAREAFIEIDSDCNGSGTCGKCLVRQVEGIVEEPHPDETRLLSRASLTQGIRLACRVNANADSAFELVRSSSKKDQILSRGLMPQFEIGPPIGKVYLELQDPSLEDPVDAILRIERALHFKLESVPLDVLRELPSVLRDAGYKVTLILSKRALLGIEPGDTSGAAFGIALDIGTTTVVASLYNLSTGLEHSVCSCVNPQKVFGMDVLSRIQHVREHERGLPDLQQAIVQGINSLVREACADADVDSENVYEMAVAANPTMMHLFLGIDPSGIGRSPYVPIFTQGKRFSAKELGVDISRSGEVFCLPSVSAYVGADIVAGILCTQLPAKKERALFIDIGTNGEIVFSSGGELFACSCAAGPALEGMNISCGMRAAEGAIERVSIENDIAIHTIGGKPAIGICGSGIIDAVGELLKAGIITKSGRYEKTLGGNLGSRLQDDNGKAGFILSFGGNGAVPVTLTQKDIRHVQLAKGAILSGILALMGHLSLKFSDVDRVYIAGAFGCNLRMENFARLGVLPLELLDRVVLVGNTSKSGAALCLLSDVKRAEATEIADKVRYFELSCHPGFDRLFAQSLSFPENCL